jgi:hypothetical protein
VIGSRGNNSDYFIYAIELLLAYCDVTDRGSAAIQLSAAPDSAVVIDDFTSFWNVSVARTGGN